MTDSIDFTNFDNQDLRVLTIVLIGIPEAVNAHIEQQHRLNLLEAAAWSKPIALANCPGKVITAINKRVAAS